jgi:hypothetical protein
VTVVVGVLLLMLGATAREAPLRLTVEAPPALATIADRVRVIDITAIGSALSRAGLELPARVHVTLVPESGARDVPAWVVARAYGSDRIVIFPARISRYPYDSLDSVVLHEIVHLALNAKAGGRALPRWFHEGVAVSVESGWGIGSQARLLLAAARDPHIDEVTALFSSAAAPETSTAYLLSAALVEDVRRRHGLDVPGVIASRVASGESFESAFYAVTGESVDAAAAHAWRVYRGIRWLPVLTSSVGLWGFILGLAFIAFVVRRIRRKRKRWEEEETDDDHAALDADRSTEL